MEQYIFTFEGYTVKNTIQDNGTLVREFTPPISWTLYNELCDIRNDDGSEK